MSGVVDGRAIAKAVVGDLLESGWRVDGSQWIKHQLASKANF